MKKTVFGILILSLFAFTHADKYLSLNFGLAPSKSILGLSYRTGANEINVGLKGFWVRSSGDYELQPGITYNRYFLKGIYGGFTYVPLYRDEYVTYGTFVGPEPTDYAFETVHEKGWTRGLIFLAVGKTFQFTSWGINIDGGLATPVTSDFARTWGYKIGAGASYRFKLD